MGLLSTSQYDNVIKFLSKTSRALRTSAPAQAIRRFHSQSFAEVQRTQTAIEQRYNIQPPKSRPVPPRSTPTPNPSSQWAGLTSSPKPLQLRSWHEPPKPEPFERPPSGNSDGGDERTRTEDTPNPWTIERKYWGPNRDRPTPESSDSN